MMMRIPNSDQELQNLADAGDDAASAELDRRCAEYEDRFNNEPDYEWPEDDDEF